MKKDIKDMSVFELADHAFLLENEVDHLNETIEELREHIAVLEGDLADMRMAMSSPWWKQEML
jgi:uncharacterized protein YaaN involved in tellurite resistance